MPRTIWKGHITFGLVNIPVNLYSGEKRNNISFHMIDSRNSRRVRYQRVNEETGDEVPWDKIVKGYEYDGGQYVLLSDDEMQEVNAKLTKRVEIEDFVDVKAIDPVYFDKPYLLEPGKGGEKGYALLRETLRMSDKIGIARVVIRAKEHLAAVMVKDDALILEIIRFPQELRSTDELDIPSAESGDIKMSKREIDLAVQLVESMTSEWDPAKYRDEYRENLMDYINEKVERGELSEGEPIEAEEEEEPEENVVDLMAYLKKSVEAAKDKSGKEVADEAPMKKKPKKKAARKAKKKAAKKSPKKKAARKTA